MIGVVVEALGAVDVSALVTGSLGVVAGAVAGFLRHRRLTRKLATDWDAQREEMLAAATQSLVDTFTAQVAGLEGRLGDLRVEMTQDRQTIADFAAKVAALTMELGEARARIFELEAAERVLTRRLEATEAERDAALGVRVP